MSAAEESTAGLLNLVLAALRRTAGGGCVASNGHGRRTARGLGQRPSLQRNDNRSWICATSRSSSPRRFQKPTAMEIRLMRRRIRSTLHWCGCSISCVSVARLTVSDSRTPLVSVSARGALLASPVHDARTVAVTAASGDRSREEGAEVEVLDVSIGNWAWLTRPVALAHRRRHNQQPQVEGDRLRQGHRPRARTTNDP